MDKASERKADTKKRDGSDKDDDYTKDFGAGGKCQYMDNLWHDPATITGGSTMQRLAQNNYCKEAHADYDKKKSSGGLLDMLIDNADTHGPPLLNTSKPRRVF
jgi:hypothetical protein